MSLNRAPTKEDQARFFNRARHKLERLIQGKKANQPLMNNHAGLSAVESLSLIIDGVDHDFEVLAETKVAAIKNFLKQANYENLTIIKGPNGTKTLCVDGHSIDSFFVEKKAA